MSFTALTRRLLFAAATVSFSLAQSNVFVLPGPGQNQAPIFAADPFASRATVSGAATAYTALSRPQGDRIYLITRAATDTLLGLDASNPGTVTVRLSLGQPAAGAAMSPDGRRLLVTAGSLFIFDTENNTLVTTSGGVPVGSTPTDVVVARDSSRAFVLSPQSQTLYAIDLTTNTVVNSVSVPGVSNGLSISPGGLLYVSATNRIYEIDPRNLLTRGEFVLNASPQRLSFTPDGRFGVAVNRTPVTGSSVLVLDLASRQVATTIPPLAANDTLDQLMVVSNARAYAASVTSRDLYEITLSPGAITRASVTQGGALANLTQVLGIAASAEVPNARYLFVVRGATLDRYDLSTSPPSLSGTFPLVSTAGGVAVTSASSLAGTPATILPYNNNQTANTGTAYFPLVVRVLDAAGRPLANAPVTFAPQVSGAGVQAASAFTNADGYAQATIVGPSTAGNFGVLVTAGPQGSPATFTYTLTAGSATGGGGTVAGGLTIVSGNGQIVLGQTSAAEPLVVEVRDPNGNLIPNSPVSFTLNGAGAFLNNIDQTCSLVSSNNGTCTTNAQGRASVGFFAAGLNPGQSFLQSSVTATASNGATADFSLLTYLRLLPDGSVAANPLVQVLQPTVDNPVITGQVGQTLAGAIQIRVTASSGFQANFPLPGVGLTVGTPNDNTGVTARCVGGTALTNDQGVATCDLVLGNRIGEAPLTINVGSFFSSLGGTPLAVRVTAGAPSVIEIQQGNNQTGNPGQRLPLALRARITDAGGNPLAGVAATFEVVTPGSVTLSNVFNTSGNNGEVSALVTLGSLPGPQQIRVRAGTATAVFTVNVNVSLGGLVAISGASQSAEVNTAFGAPVVVEVRDANSAPLAGTTVTFAVSSGAATLAAQSVTTDAQGRASTTVRAGATAGPVVVTASVPGFSTTFALTVRPAGPVEVPRSIVNAASFERGVTPGGLATIIGPGLAAGIQGTVLASPILGGPLPTSFNNAEVRINNIAAPIYSVSNTNGQEQITVLVPFEVSPGTATVAINVAGTTTTTPNVPVLPLQPGLFETTLPNGRRLAVAVKENGTYVSPENPARLGETLRVFATGLGQTSPSLVTNAVPLINQRVVAPVTIGLNNAGFPATTAEALAFRPGLYVVSFTVSNNAAGSEVPFVIAVPDGAGNLVFSNGSNLPVQ